LFLILILMTKYYFHAGRQNPARNRFVIEFFNERKSACHFDKIVFSRKTAKSGANLQIMRFAPLFARSNVSRQGGF